MHSLLWEHIKHFCAPPPFTIHHQAPASKGNNLWTPLNWHTQRGLTWPFSCPSILFTLFLYICNTLFSFKKTYRIREITILSFIPFSRWHKYIIASIIDCISFSLGAICNKFIYNQHIAHAYIKYRFLFRFIELYCLLGCQVPFGIHRYQLDY